jgi:IclR family acetate operon transcriptional repressor
MQRLLERFGETVNLAVKQGRDVVIIDALESQQSIKRGATIGQRDNWFCSSLGKAMLAFMPLEEVNALLEMFPLERRTPNTLSTRKALLDGLEEIRVVGYAIDDEEAEFGLRCVGVPLLDFRGRPTHALSISGPADRLDEQQRAQMGGELLRAAREISHYSAVGASQEGSLAEEIGVR